MDDLNAMFGGDADPIDVPATEPIVEQETPVSQPVPEPVIEQPVEKPQVPEGYVPLHVVKELRDEIRSLKTTPPVQNAMPQEELYPDEDTLKIVNNYMRQQTMQFSRMQAEDKFGADSVQTAYDWAFERCGSDPAFNLAVAQSPHPYKFIVEEHRRAQSLQELGNVDPEQIRAFKQWQAAQQQIAVPVAPVSPAATPPPRSIASETSAGDAKPPKVSAEEERLAKMF